MWGISNLAGDSLTYAQIMLDRGVVPLLTKLIYKKRTEYSFLRNLVWALNNLSKGKPYPPFELVKFAFSIVLTWF